MDARRTAHLYRVIDAAKMLGVGLVNTFIGRDRTKTVEENLETVQKVWPEILQYAADRQIRIGIENCPMLFGKEQWPGGENLMTTPAIWKKIFQMLPFDNFGLNAFSIMPFLNLSYLEEYWQYWMVALLTGPIL